MGTNEAANVAAGSTVGYDDRIDSDDGDDRRREPVLWVNVKSLVASGPYAADEHGGVERGAAARPATRYPNMRVYDWASDVKDDWFIPDGIHFTTPGYAARGRLIADALLEAFPAATSPPPTRLHDPTRATNCPSAPTRLRPNPSSADLEERPAVVEAERGLQRVAADRRRAAACRSACA